ncbi:MAG TPA: hypothetical protein VN177_00410 [Myxococcales bacterium]|nr:hypothetical protein [Myxococcales bacterium]
MKRLIVSSAALLVLACTRSSSAPVSFSVATATTATASSALVVAGNIDVQRVRLNVGRLKLEAQGSGTESDGEHDDGEHDEDGGMTDGGTGDVGEVEISQGPFLIDLDAAALSAGAVTKVFDAQVPAGTYQELKLEIFPSAALQNASVIVDGTVAGKAFSFSSALVAKQKKEGSFVVGGSTANITLLIDPQQWFGTAAAPLDPTVETNRAAIEENIRRSIDVFQDDDSSGHENHDGDHDDGQHRDGGHGDGGHG